MSKLLLSLKASQVMTLEINPPLLEIYDDKIYFKDKGLIGRKESTIFYNQIAQVNIKRGLMHSSLEIVNTGGAKNIKVDHLTKSQAEEAKEIIEKQLHNAHNPNQSLEKSDDPMEKLTKLKVLLDSGIINQDEFDEQKKKLLSSI